MAKEHESKGEAKEASKNGMPLSKHHPKKAGKHAGRHGSRHGGKK